MRQLKESQVVIVDLTSSLAAEHRLVENQRRKAKKARLEAAKAFMDGFFNFAN